MMATQGPSYNWSMCNGCHLTLPYPQLSWVRTCRCSEWKGCGTEIHIILPDYTLFLKSRYSCELKLIENSNQAVSCTHIFLGQTAEKNCLNVFNENILLAQNFLKRSIWTSPHPLSFPSKMWVDWRRVTTWGVASQPASLCFRVSGS